MLEYCIAAIVILLIVLIFYKKDTFANGWFDTTVRGVVDAKNEYIRDSRNDVEKKFPYGSKNRNLGQIQAYYDKYKNLIRTSLPKDVNWTFLLPADKGLSEEMIRMMNAIAEVAPDAHTRIDPVTLEIPTITSSGGVKMKRETVPIFPVAFRYRDKRIRIDDSVVLFDKNNIVDFLVASGLRKGYRW